MNLTTETSAHENILRSLYPYLIAQTMVTSNLLKALKAKQPAFGAWLTLPGSISARTASHASPYLSWVCIDCEHGLTPLQPGVAESIQAIAQPRPGGEEPPSALVRIPATGGAGPGGVGWQIKYALDAGARGVIVPMAGAMCLTTKSNSDNYLVGEHARTSDGRGRGQSIPACRTAWVW